VRPDAPAVRPDAPLVRPDAPQNKKGKMNCYFCADLAETFC